MLGARKLLLVLVAGLATSLALAGPGGGGGGGKGGGGGGPGGGGGGGGSGKPGSSVDDFYGDMALIDRDINGVPILVEGLGPKDQMMMVRAPIVFPDKLGDEGCPLTLAEAEAAGLGEGSIYTFLGIDAYRIPMVDGEIPEAFAGCVTEADFGRLSVMRSPPQVLDAGLLELVTVVTTPGVTLGLDEPGRLTITYEEDGVVIEKTIDAPRENLAGFQKLLEAGELSHPEVNGEEPVALEERPVHEGAPERAALLVLDRAAAMLGAAADKFGKMGLDELMYATAMLDIGGDMNAEAKALFGLPNTSPGESGFQYFSFYKYEYNRAATYAGDVCYLKVMDIDDSSPPVSAEVQVVREPILQVVFPPLAEGVPYIGGLELLTHADGFQYTGFSGTNAWGFARAVDDARAVINWMHEHPVPIELAEYCE